MSTSYKGMAARTVQANWPTARKSPTLKPKLIAKAEAQLPVSLYVCRFLLCHVQSELEAIRMTPSVEGNGLALYLISLANSRNTVQ